MVKRKSATNKKTDKKRNQKQSLPPTQCKGCGTMFIPKDRRTKFHSEQCRQELYDTLYYKKKKVEKTCPNCLETFLTSMPLKQVYCSDDCREGMRKKSREDLQEQISSTREEFIKDRFLTIKKYKSRCSFCGRDISDGIKLNVIDNAESETGYCTICDLCSEGKDLLTGSTSTK